MKVQTIIDHRFIDKPIFNTQHNISKTQAILFITFYQVPQCFCYNFFSSIQNTKKKCTFGSFSSKYYESVRVPPAHFRTIFTGSLEDQPLTDVSLQDYIVRVGGGWGLLLCGGWRRLFCTTRASLWIIEVIYFTLHFTIQPSISHVRFARGTWVLR